jgi:hypothetical protein
MELSREEVEKIAAATAQSVLENLHQYAVEYKAPATIEQGLRDSMIEEKTAIDWYRKRAKHAHSLKREDIKDLYEHIAEEEEQHYKEFAQELPYLAKGKGGFTIHQDRMGSIIVGHTGESRDVLLQFEADKEVVIDLLKEDERVELEEGYNMAILDAEPRATILQELWEVQKLDGPVVAKKA